MPDTRSENFRGRASVLRQPAFRNLWLAQTTSVLGDRLVIVALALFVTDLTGSATDLGLVLGAQTIPLVGFLLLGGVWADRLPRAKLIIATDVARALLHGLLAALIFAGTVEIWHLVVIEALYGTAEAFFRPAYTGLLPRTVAPEEIQQAHALTNMTSNLAELAGPALATILVLGLGAGWAFLLDALTFVASALFMLRVRLTGPAVAPAPRVSFMRELEEGFGQVRSRTWLWVTVAVFAVALPIGYAPLFVVGPGVMADEYGSTALFGVLTTVLGAGAIAGAVTGLRWRPGRPLRAAFLVVASWPVLLVALGAGAPVAVVLGTAGCFGFGFALFDVWWSTALAQQIPPDALSRVSSYDWMGSLVLLPVGFIVAGPLAEAWGATSVLLWGGVLTALVLAAGFAPRQTRELRGLASPGAALPQRTR